MINEDVAWNIIYDYLDAAWVAGLDRESFDLGKATTELTNTIYGND